MKTELTAAEPWNVIQTMDVGLLRARRVSSESYVTEDMENGSAFHGRPSIERPFNEEDGRDEETLVGELQGSNEAEILNGFQNRKPSYSTKDEKWKWWKVYALHFLFMWNTRTYEYASILLVALAFPNDLTAASIRGITSTVSAMLCASVVGSWIDRAPSKLPPLLISILANHGAITIAYLSWLLWHAVYGTKSEDNPVPKTTSTQVVLFGFILILDMVQDLSAIGNRLSLERDWVPALVEPVPSQTKYGLTQVNAVMRRIDMICKLVAPSLLPLVVSNITSHIAWIMILAGITLVLGALEIWCARVISRENPQLGRSKSNDNDPANTFIHEHKSKGRVLNISHRLYKTLFTDPLSRFMQYFSMSIWPASMALAMLQMTVLAYSATLVTYLLEVGFSLSSITIARASGSIMALASTFITPITVRYLMRREEQHDIDVDGCQDGKHGIVVRKVGLWGIISQFICMLPVVVVLWTLSQKPAAEIRDIREAAITSSSYVIPSLVLFTFLSISRIGHWMFDLMIQEIEQVEIPASQRSTFAGTEQSFRSFFELSHWGATVVWSRPEGFRWLALGSWAVLGIGATTFGAWSYTSNSRKEIGDVRYEGLPMADIEREES